VKQTARFLAGGGGGRGEEGKGRVEGRVEGRVGGGVGGGKWIEVEAACVLLREGVQRVRGRGQCGGEARGRVGVV
jgi:hypothetical protein